MGVPKITWPEFITVPINLWCVCDALYFYERLTSEEVMFPYSSMVEQHTHNVLVPGSMPGGGTKENI